MLTQEQLKEEVKYDPTTGVFTRLRTHRAVKAGDAAGTTVTASKGLKSYVRICIKGKYHYAHRLAYLYMLGAFPLGEVDHINQDSLDNRWANLRNVTHRENGKNQKKYKNNPTGHTGIQQRANGKYRARICIQGKHINVGTFDTLQAACTARLVANEEYGFHANHGI